MAIKIYNKASEKKPAMKLNDLINALKKSGKVDLTDQLMQDMMSKAHQLDII